MEDSNGQYDMAALWNRPTAVYNAPTGSWEDTLLRQASLVVTMDRAEVSAVVRPALPQILPPDMKVRHRPTFGIQDAITGLGRNNDNLAQYSGSPAGYSGSPQNGFGGAIT